MGIRTVGVGGSGSRLCTCTPIDYSTAWHYWLLGTFHLVLAGLFGTLGRAINRNGRTIDWLERGMIIG